MILFLCCDSVIEKAILYTSLSIAKPDNFEVVSTCSVSEIKKDSGNKIVLKTPVETKEIYDTKTVNKLKRLIKDDKVRFLEIPRYVEPIKAAETMEVDELKLLKIETLQMNLPEPTAKSVGEAFQNYLESEFGTKFVINV
jgi:hypothetical protein|nr:MAG TPA: hypothetical protein [Myoviridae sp. ctTS62]